MQSALYWPIRLDDRTHWAGDYCILGIVATVRADLVNAYDRIVILSFGE
jgi:hypothetical protein